MIQSTESTKSTESLTDRFFRFERHRMIALLIVTITLGTTVMSLILSAKGAVSNPANLAWWLLPVAVSALVAIQTSISGRGFKPDSPEVNAVAQDEWRQAIINRATRWSLVVVLLLQWPLGIALGSLSWLDQPRPTMAMATATIWIEIKKRG
jgi:hypothetical protein